jgi:hypothetical protein
MAPALGFSRLHRDLLEFDSQRIQRRFDGIVGAHADPAAGYDQITSRQGIDRSYQDIWNVGEPTNMNDLCSSGHSSSGERRTIGVDDLSRSRNPPGIHEFITRRQDRHTPDRADRDARHSGREQRCKLRGTDDLALIEHNVPLTDVVTSGPNVTPAHRWHPRIEQVLSLLDLFDGEDGFGASGQGGTGHDPHRRSGIDRDSGCLSSSHLTDHPKKPGDVVHAHRVSIHGTRGESGQLYPRHNVGGEYESDTGGYRD